VSLFADTLDSTATVNIVPNIPDGFKLVYLNQGILKPVAGANDSALLIATSNAVNNTFPIIIGTSNAVNNLYPIIIGTSNAMNDYQPLIVANSNAIVTMAGQSAAAANAALATIDHGPANIHYSSGTVTMSYDVYVSADHTLNIHSSGVIDGSGHTINFTCSAGPILYLDPGVTVTLQNVELDAFAPELVSYGAGAQLLFGQDVEITLCRNVDLNVTWSFIGDASIKGDGYELNLVHQDALMVADTKTLTLEDVVVAGLGGSGANNMRIVGQDGTIACRNSELLMEANFSFTAGKLDIYHDVKLKGEHIFAYTSPQDLTIATDAALLIDRGVTFSYDSTDGVAPKDHVVLVDQTAQL
jgi:hypothetical protein